MRSYECAVIFVPGVSDDLLKAQTQKYMRVVADNGGEMTRLETWGKRKLAYEINHNSEGYYYFFKFRAKGPVLEELGRQMRIDENIIRHMIIRDELAAGDEPTLEPDKIEAVGASESQEA